jgi:hypothetical protein
MSALGPKLTFRNVRYESVFGGERHQGTCAPAPAAARWIYSKLLGWNGPGPARCAWPASRGIRKHDSLDRWDWHNHQSARGGEIVYPIPHWIGCQTSV